jgi:hypothetical protein
MNYRKKVHLEKQIKATKHQDTITNSQDILMLYKHIN